MKTVVKSFFLSRLIEKRNVHVTKFIHQGKKQQLLKEKQNALCQYSDRQVTKKTTFLRVESAYFYALKTTSFFKEKVELLMVNAVSIVSLQIGKFF